jgi:hypothetical protein
MGIADLRFGLRKAGWSLPTVWEPWDNPGRFLFDLDDPSKEIGRLKDPLLSPEDEREGYVPNVVYSCGSIIHNNSLYYLMPYRTTLHLWVVDMVEWWMHWRKVNDGYTTKAYRNP